MESQRFQPEEPPEQFLKLVATEIIPRLHLDGYKIQQQHEIAAQLAHALVVCGLVGKSVADSRSTTDAITRRRVRVWDRLYRAGFTDITVGSEASQKVTRYLATADLLDLQTLWNTDMLADTTLARATDPHQAATRNCLLLLHTGKVDPSTGLPHEEGAKKQPLNLFHYLRETCPDPLEFKRKLTKLIRIEDKIDRINSNNLDSSWKVHAWCKVSNKLRALQPLVTLHQIHAGRLGRAARLYTTGPMGLQSLDKQTRSTLQIDREPATELDFKCMGIRLLYHAEGHDPQISDLYRPESIFREFWGCTNVSTAHKARLRKFVKLASNICLNVKSRSAANSSVANLIRQSNHKKLLHRVLRVEGLNVEGVVNRIVESHDTISHHFFTEAGMRSMTLDGRIMLRLLLRFADHEKPAMGLHDALLVRDSDRDFARKVMAEIYESLIGFKPVIR